MSDIFISYSRKDSEQALSLAERLRNDGMSVWIDQQGIEAAKTWSEEIVNAIEASKAFVLLLSEHSVESGNVAKELSLAYESERALIPVMIQDVPLTAKFKYPLAGVQRVAYTQFDAITQALVGCGVAVTKASERKKDERKSVLVMPFEDLSPTQDNLWFADGLAGELIDKLSQIKALRLIDRKTSRDLRDTKLRMIEITETLGVRYVIEGSIRKFGEQIKISATLLDVHEGEHLWQGSQKGEMKDVFELQEHVAEHIVEGLQLSLDLAERKSLTRELTCNAEAYQYYLKASEQYSYFTRPAMELALSLWREAIRLDPQFVAAYSNMLIALLELYRMKNDESYLEEAKRAIERIHEIEGESYDWLFGQATLALRVNDLDRSIEYSRRAIQLDPLRPGGYDTLALALKAKNDHAGAVEPMRTYARIRGSLHAHEKFLFYLSEADMTEELRKQALEVRPRFEQQLKLHPHDIHNASTYASILHWTGESDAAIREIDRLLQYPLSGPALYNLSCLLCDLDQLDRAMGVLRQAIEGGYSQLEFIRRDPDLRKLHGREDFEILTQSPQGLNAITSS